MMSSAVMTATDSTVSLILRFCLVPVTTIVSVSRGSATASSTAPSCRPAGVRAPRASTRTNAPLASRFAVRPLSASKRLSVCWMVKFPFTAGVDLPRTRASSAKTETPKVSETANRAFARDCASILTCAVDCGAVSCAAAKGAVVSAPIAAIAIKARLNDLLLLVSCVTALAPRQIHAIEDQSHRCPNEV